MAESFLGHFYLEISHSNFSACLLVTDRKEWRFMNASPAQAWGKDPSWQRGTYKERWGSATEGMMDFYPSNSDTPGFHLSHVKFPPSVKSDHTFFENQFHLGTAWAKQIDAEGLDKRGSWAAIATGPLVTEVKRYAEAMQKEFKEICIMLGLDIAAMVDPTGLMNFPAAVQASRMGDYLGCALNLLGLIPVIGKAANAAKNAKAIQRISFLTQELEFIKRWMEISTKALKRGNIGETGLNASIQGTTRASKVEAVAEAAIAAVKPLKNQGWVQKLTSRGAEEMGILVEELTAFRKLANEGYYFVVRACNPERVRWLKWAKNAKARILSKPMWIKWKTLKKSNCSNGLVGIMKTDFAHSNTIENLRRIATERLPSGFDLKFLQNIQGAYPRPPKIYQVTKDFKLDGIEDAERMLDHYFVDMGDCFILVDSKGAAYIGDIDIVSIQRRLQNGSFGPPGFNVGPVHKVSPYRGGSDSAELESFFNRFFQSVGYPPGYDVFQHGGISGTAGFYKKLKEQYDALGGAAKTGWNPGKDWDMEQLLVAVKGLDGLDGVGFTKGWDALKNFHNANPMGEFRFSK